MKMHMNELECFSFKDAMATVFISFFLYEVIIKDYQMVGLLVPLVAVILG